MGIFSNRFSVLKKADVPYYRMPKSTQQAIELYAISDDGMFLVSRNKYSKSYLFRDVNYTTASEKEQESLFLRYCRILNSFECEFKITINDKNKDMDDFRENILIKYTGNEDDEYRSAYNDVIEKKINVGRQGIDKEMYLTISVVQKSYEEAKSQFFTLEANLAKAFQTIGTSLSPLNAEERIKILYGYYHLGHEKDLSISLAGAKKRGTDFKNELCNSMMKINRDDIEDEYKISQVLFFKTYPNSLSDRFITDLMALPYHMILSIDGVPVPKDLTLDVLKKKYMGIENDIIRQQRARNRNNDFSSEISYSKRKEKKDFEGIMDDVRENDSSLFFVSVNLVIMAEDRERLKNIRETVRSLGKRNGVVVEIHYFQQREALNTALPVGVRQVETSRAMLTQSLAALMPFNVQELCEPGGCFYGINQISKNVNVGNRKKLVNGNGFVFGVPGSGKSFFCKMEMGNVFLSSDDCVIVVDPQNEYFDMAERYHGTVVNMSTYTKQHINPFDLDVWSLEIDPYGGLVDNDGLVRSKGEFMLGLCEQCIGESLNARQKSIIDRCVQNLYRNIAKSTERYIPTMEDFYNLLQKQEEPEARDVALALELFVNGSLNIFCHQTNVDVDNRFMIFGIRDLGTELMPIAMLIMLENIEHKIIENGLKGKATWLYVDEFHVLLNSEYSAKYLQQLWKKVRKQGGLCTGITQNITDLFVNEISTTMISNSEFVALLRQSQKDSDKVAYTLRISEEQLRFVTNSQSGTGLLKCGNIVVPFDSQIDKDSALYKLYNTNLHEKMEEERKKRG